jgi:hypothetical protein
MPTAKEGNWMRRSIAKVRWVTVALAMILLAGVWLMNSSIDVPAVSAAQNPMSPELPPLPPPFGNGPPIGVDNNPTQAQIQKVQNAERQKQLAQDTDKLLALAKQLKQEVNKSSGSVLPVDAAKKAAQIEKLAKSVQSEIHW